MWATLALSALTLTPSQGGSLAIKNPRPTYGILGQERKDKKLLIGDVLTLAYDVEGLQTQEDGLVKYSISMELLDKAGKSQFKQEAQDYETVNSLGGNRVTAFAVVEIRTDTKPGDYVLKVTIKDRLANASRDLSYPFEVAPASLGFVQCTLAYPAGEYRAAPPIAAPGQAYWVNFAVVGFELDKKNSQPNLSVEMRIIDTADGKPTLAKTPRLDVDGAKSQIDERWKKVLPLQFPLQLNRPGRFVIEMTVKDNISNKTAKQTLEFTVQETR